MKPFRSISRLLMRQVMAVAICAVTLIDASAAGLAPLQPRSTASSPSRRVANLPVSADITDLRGLVGNFGSVSAPQKGAGDRWMILIQDVHGNPVAQRNAASALERIFASRLGGALVLEGQTRPIDVKILRGVGDHDGHAAAIDKLFGEGEISGAAWYLLRNPDAVAAVAPLDRETLYRANIAALRATLDLQPKMLAELERTSRELAGLKKRHYNPGLYVVDLALARYESGRLPLSSLLATLRHRGDALDYVSSTFLRADTLASLYDTAEVGTELKRLLARLQGRLSRSDSASLTDAAFRFQKGTLDIGPMVSILAGATSRSGISLNEYPNLAVHLERTLVTRAIDPSKVLGAVDEISRGLPQRLAVTHTERGIASMTRRVRLLDRLARLSLTPQEWNELKTTRMKDVDGLDVRAVRRRIENIEARMIPAKLFYARASARNDVFAARLGEAAGSKGNLVVVAGGFHASEIEAAARRQGFGTVVFTPLLGDARTWDSAGPLKDLVAPRGAFSGLDVRSETLAPRPLPATPHIQLAAAAIARAAISGREEDRQWGRNQLGYLGARLKGTDVKKTASGVNVDVTIETDEKTETIRISLSGKEVAFITLSWPFVSIFRYVKSSVVRQYYRWFGIPLKGVGLHTGKPVNVRVYPRTQGQGIRIVQPIPEEEGGSSEPTIIQVLQNFIAPNRRRYTAIEKFGRKVMMMEHGLFAMRTLNIWDADIHIDGEEMPILDGSARMYLDALMPLKNWSEPPPEEFLDHPVVFWRDNTTAIVLLPLDEEGREETFDLEVTFIGNYPKQTRPMEFTHRFHDDDPGHDEAVLGSLPTFTEVKKEELNRIDLFKGALAYAPGEQRSPNRNKGRDVIANYVDISNPESWDDPQTLRELAAHKVMDVRGDLMLAELTTRKRYRFIAWVFGAGHRDNNRVFEQLTSGYRFPVHHERIMTGNIATLIEKSRISEERMRRFRADMEPYRNYDETLSAEINEPGLDEIPADVLARLEDAFQWVPGRETPVQSDAAMRRIKDYLLRAGGSSLAAIADRIATQKFVPEDVKSIQVELWDETSEEQVFRVSFSRGNEAPEGQPRVAIVLAREGSINFEQSVFSMRRADEANERRRRREMGPAYAPRTASDRAMPHFPKIGDMKDGIYAREWLADQYARFTHVPSAPRVDLRNEDSALSFDMHWEQPRQTLQRRSMSAADGSAVASATAEMMTDAFLQMMRSAPLKKAPATGHLIEGIDFRQDLVYDPIDKRAGLSVVRRSRLVEVEEFLYNVFYLKMTVRIPTGPSSSSSAELREWQPFAMETAALIRGIQLALEKEFGPVEGKRIALDWFKRYRAGPFGAIGPGTEQTTRYRSLNAESLVVKEVPGQSVHRELDLRITELETAMTANESFSTILWVAKVLTLITGFPVRVWARWSPVVEQVLFSGSLFVATVILQQVAESGSVGIGANVALIAVGLFGWFASHLRVIVKNGEALQTASFGSLPLKEKIRIALTGLATVVLPTIGFAFSPFAGISMSLLAMTLHYALNPSVGGTVDGEAGPIVDEGRDVARMLQSAV